MDGSEEEIITSSGNRLSDCVSDGKSLAQKAWRNACSRKHHRKIKLPKVRDVPQYVTTCITTAYRYSAMVVASTANTLAKFKYKFTSATSSTTSLTLWRCEKEEQSGGRD